MSNNPTPTLYDVSEKAGVSTATVSRALNFPDRVAEKTRKRVMDAVTALGYSPNFGARAMASRRTNTIGAVIPTMANAMFARGLQAFEEELRRHGFTILVASTSYQPNIEIDQIRSLVARGADGLLLIGHHRDPEIYDFLKAQDVPTLVTWAYDPSEPRPSVGFDNRVAMKAMANEVIKMGHTKIALISGESSLNDRADARIHGVEDAMADAGLDPSDLNIHETTFGIEEGARGFDAVMMSMPRPTAIMCSADVLAVGAMRRARELGISVPEDVSITGFDDLELAQVVHPPLTTVFVPHAEMGRRAGLALARQLTDGTPMGTTELATQPILRGTLAPPKDGTSD
ncbi:LacI family DNA-binding transcriptional regulator [Octadecabacter sp. 1_MG-2023]|uniref:LacI family DNA-binding transcriptional regulator n=1 Tax=unclassified Octadecabacter TaxID=196158 RepID=UPI001C0967A5|nr:MULTISPECIES: LacI family DNA-binding transcriptional regulator [unclassified Octadecabacter]MBU2993969.1 LacI family DNA-binding transcriptional regulator [Octadecabacter sp. B2R22]MDO6735185.1 LacI family DNA-binding transcriptional regulator [Octadecabacter sp. 1_MG-2023]